VSLGEANGTYFKQAHACLELVGHPKLKLPERILCFALVACTLETFCTSRQPNPIHRRVLESLTEMITRYNLHELDGEGSLWMGLIIAGPPSSTASVHQEGDVLDRVARQRNILLDMVVSKSRNARDWKWVEETVQKFFWDERLLPRWRSAWELSVQQCLGEI
jgi:hypothetical protein